MSEYSGRVGLELVKYTKEEDGDIASHLFYLELYVHMKCLIFDSVLILYTSVELEKVTKFMVLLSPLYLVRWILLLIRNRDDSEKASRTEIRN